MSRLLRDFQQFWRDNSDIWQGKFDYKEAEPHLVLQAFLQCDEFRRTDHARNGRRAETPESLCGISGVTIPYRTQNSLRCAGSRRG